MRRLLVLAIGLVLAGCTVTPAQEAVAPTPSASVAPSPSWSPKPYTPPPFSPKPSDFTVDVIVKAKKCYGSAGCNVTIDIEPGYVGAATLPDAGTTEVTYRVLGVEDDYVNTFTLEGTQVSFRGDDMVRTKSSDAELTAEVTRVVYRS